MKIYIGIDPGKQGAVAILKESVVLVIDTPTTEIITNQKTKKGNKKKKNLYLESKMANILRLYSQKYEIHVAIEKVHSMPKQGVTSMFSMGEGYGIWIGILSALQIPYTKITPQSWKKEMLEGLGKEKSMSCYRAQQLFPEGKFYTEKGRALDGRGDAVCIAEYAKRKNL